MSDYNPDRWVMLKFANGGQTTYKILAGWGGSYMHGQSWKLNSGITKIEQDGDYYLFSGYSGSVYKCHKNAYGTTGISAAMYASWSQQIADAGKPEDTMVMMPEETNFMEIDYAD